MTLASSSLDRDLMIEVYRQNRDLAQVLLTWYGRGGVRLGVDDEALARDTASIVERQKQLNGDLSPRKKANAKQKWEHDVLPQWFWSRLPQHEESTIEEFAQLKKDFGFRKRRSGGTGLGRLDRFDVLRRIGRGGMGVVFEARSSTGWLKGNHVAIKTICPDWVCPELLKRFRDEAKMMKALSDLRPSPQNVVRILDTLELRGNLGIVMEYICGPTLDDLISQHPEKPVPTCRAIDFLLQIARGLQAAHKKPDGPITHRDLKPGNVFLRAVPACLEYPFGWQVFVGDFGLALPSEVTAITRSGGGSGTEGFMAPEQRRPGTKVDPSCDLFLLGITAYLLLTGKHPFNIGTIGTPIYDPQFVLRSGPRSHSTEVPEELNRLVLQLLIKNEPEKRGDIDKIVSSLQSLLTPFLPGVGFEDAPSPMPPPSGSVTKATAGELPSSKSEEFRLHRQAVVHEIASGLDSLDDSVRNRVVECVRESIEKTGGECSEADFENNLAEIIVDRCPASELLGNLNVLIRGDSIDRESKTVIAGLIKWLIPLNYDPGLLDRLRPGAGSGECLILESASTLAIAELIVAGLAKRSSVFVPSKSSPKLVGKLALRWERPPTFGPPKVTDRDRPLLLHACSVMRQLLAVVETPFGEWSAATPETEEQQKEAEVRLAKFSNVEIEFNHCVERLKASIASSEPYVKQYKRTYYCVLIFPEPSRRTFACEVLKRIHREVRSLQFVEILPKDKQKGSDLYYTKLMCDHIWYAEGKNG